MKQIFLLLFLSSCMWHDGHYISDNPIEEIGEGILQHETGIDLDFSPGTPEKKIEAPKRPSRVFVPHYPDEERPKIWFCLVEF